MCWFIRGRCALLLGARSRAVRSSKVSWAGEGAGGPRGPVAGADSRQRGRPPSSNQGKLAALPRLARGSPVFR